MNNSKITITLILCALCAMYSSLTHAQTNESFENFCVRMQQTYDVKIINTRETPLSQKEQTMIEEVMDFWGADIFKALSSYYRYKHDILSHIIISINPDNPSLYGNAKGFTINLYGTKWDQITLIHETTHMLHNFWFELSNYETTKETEYKLSQCNDGRLYGQPWQNDDNQFFAFKLSKTDFKEDMATLMPLLFKDKKFYEKINSGQLPAYKKKYTIIRDYIYNYIAPTKLFDSILETESSVGGIKICIPKDKLITLTKGQTYQIEFSNILPVGASSKINYTSSKPSIASVSANGLITYNGPGKATITIQPEGAKIKSNCYVSDKIEATSYTFNSQQATIEQGEYYQLGVTLIPQGSTGELRYLSDNNNVATVDKNGRIKGIAPGSTKIGVMLFNSLGGISMPSFSVTVLPSSGQKTTAKTESSSSTASSTAKVSNPDSKTSNNVKNNLPNSEKENPKPVVDNTTLTIKSGPSKTTYTVGELFDPAGLTAYYTRSTGQKSNDLSPQVLVLTTPNKKVIRKGTKLTEAGKMEITVSYATYSAKINIEVVAAAEKSFEGLYKIFAATSDKQCIGVRRSNMENGAEVIVAPSLNNTDQQFEFEKVGDKYRIKAKHSGKYLTIDGSHQNGAFITQSDKGNDDMQLFTIVECGNNAIKLKTTKGFIVTPLDGNLKSATRIVISNETNKYNQQLRLIAVKKL